MWNITWCISTIHANKHFLSPLIYPLLALSLSLCSLSFSLRSEITAVRSKKEQWQHTNILYVSYTVSNFSYWWVYKNKNLNLHRVAIEVPLPFFHLKPKFRIKNVLNPDGLFRKSGFLTRPSSLFTIYKCKKRLICTAKEFKTKTMFNSFTYK